MGRVASASAFARRILFTGVAAFEHKSTAAQMRVVYFSASPRFKTAEKSNSWDPVTLDWSAEFKVLQERVAAVGGGARLALEFHGDGTIDQLAAALAEESSVPQWCWCWRAATAPPRRRCRL